MKRRVENPGGEKSITDAPIWALAAVQHLSVPSLPSTGTLLLAL